MSNPIAAALADWEEFRRTAFDPDALPRISVGVVITCDECGAKSEELAADQIDSAWRKHRQRFHTEI